MKKIKPCPFCGGKAILTSFRYYPDPDLKEWYLATSFYSIRCSNCLMMQNDCGDGYSTAARAINAWNKRHENP